MVIESAAQHPATAPEDSQASDAVELYQSLLLELAEACEAPKRLTGPRLLAKAAEVLASVDALKAAAATGQAFMTPAGAAVAVPVHEGVATCLQAVIELLAAGCRSESNVVRASIVQAGSRLAFLAAGVSRLAARSAALPMPEAVGATLPHRLSVLAARCGLPMSFAESDMTFQTVLRLLYAALDHDEQALKALGVQLPPRGLPVAMRARMRAVADLAAPLVLAKTAERPKKLNAVRVNLASLAHWGGALEPVERPAPLPAIEVVRRRRRTRVRPFSC